MNVRTSATESPNLCTFNRLASDLHRPINSGITFSVRKRLIMNMLRGTAEKEPDGTRIALGGRDASGELS